MGWIEEVPRHKIKMTESIRLIPREERIKKIKEAGYNVFLLKSRDVFIDLLSDSGTNAMSDAQWSAMFNADEAYSGAESFYRMEKSIQEITGLKYVLPVHQGRAAENVLDTALVKEGDCIPGNIHFDTTRAHIQYRKATGPDCAVGEAFDCEKECQFKGNIDLKKLDEVIKKHGAKKIPYVLLTVTCNSGGGQPASMQNIKEVRKICDKNGIKLFFDAARFSENAFFIKQREKGYENKSIQEIVKEMFSFVDGCTMSAKKAAIVNMGGFLAFREKELFDKCAPFAILFEGYPTYGGMSGREMEAIAVGLREGIDEDYLRARIAQVRYLGESLANTGIPIMKPVGGHAVFIDGKKFLPHIPQEQFPSFSLSAELYLEAGIRGVEIGTVMAGRNPKTGKNVTPKLDLMRLTIPRRVYLKEHMDYIAEAMKKIKERKHSIKGLKFTYESPILRHFWSRFEPVK